MTRSQTGKRKMSPAKKMEVELMVVAHLETVAGLFPFKSIDENDAENPDKTRFFISVDNRKTLGICGATEFKYTDVVSGGQ